MNEFGEFELLQDLAKLLRKHGPDAFEKLGQQLEKPEFIERLRLILLAGTSAARQSRRLASHLPSPARSLHDYRLSLLDHEQLGAEKSALLVRLYDDSMAKKLLPTMRELRTFAESLGLQIPKALVRPKAIVEIVEGLRHRPLEALRSILSQLPPAKTVADRSLENWTRIIFDKELRSRKAE